MIWECSASSLRMRAKVFSSTAVCASRTVASAREGSNFVIATAYPIRGDYSVAPFWGGVTSRLPNSPPSLFQFFVEQICKENPEDHDREIIRIGWGIGYLYPKPGKCKDLRAYPVIGDEGRQRAIEGRSVSPEGGRQQCHLYRRGRWEDHNRPRQSRNHGQEIRNHHRGRQQRRRHGSDQGHRIGRIEDQARVLIF